MDRRRFLSLGCVALSVAGCSSLPDSGPSAGDIRSGATTVLKSETASAVKYALVELSSVVLAALGDPGPGSLYKSFGTGRRGPPETKVGIGDSVQVTIFESSAGGLFIPTDAGARAGNFVTLPAQSVDQTGYISVPYAGSIMAKNRSLPDIQHDIEQKLLGRAIEPQVVLSLTSSTSTQVTVIGRVGSANKITLGYADRVLDVLARTGGIADPGYEAFITLQRGNKRASVYFLNLLQNAQENIYVEPGDTIYVFQQQRAFNAFGASGTSGQFKFEQEHLLLSDAVGKAGGLLDNRADPGMVLLYRLEHRKLLEKMHVDLSGFPPQMETIPTIYRANFRDPASFFIAKSFYMQDRDVIYVTNADQVELNKFLGLATSVPDAISTITSDAVTTRNAIRQLANGR
eukprot:gene19513-19942_t